MKVHSALAFTTLTLGTICLTLQIASLISPNWGSFSINTRDSTTSLIDAGYFGPWKTCIHEQWSSSAKKAVYETLCEPGITEYIPPRLITSAGILAVVNAVLLCQYIPLAIIHVVKIIKKDNDLILKMKTIIIFKIILTIMIALLSVSVLGFFAGSKSPTNKFITDYEWGFYVIVVTCVLSFGLTGVTEAEFFIYKRLSEKEKKARDPTGVTAETFRNPGFGTPKRVVGNNHPSHSPRNGRMVQQSSDNTSTTNTVSTMNHSTDSTYLETTFNGSMDHKTLRKVDPSFDTGTSYPNPHFMSSSSPKRNFRKNTQV